VANDRKKAEPVQTVPPLTVEQKWMMLAIIVRHELAFNRAKAYLQVTHFRQHDDWVLLVIWSAVLRCLNRLGPTTIPTLLMLQTEAMADLQLMNAGQPQRQMVQSFLQYAHGLQFGERDVQMAMWLLQQFLQHAAANELMHKLAAPAKPADLFSMLDHHTRQVEQIQADLQRPEALEAIRESADDDSECLPPEPTPLFMVNAFTMGGMRRGDVYGVLAPFGGGKTTAMTHLCVDTSERYLADWVAGGQRSPLGLVYYFAYEDPLSDLNARMLSCRGRISLTRLREGKPSQRLSRTGYLEYEQNRLGAQVQTGSLPTEYQRYEIAKSGLNWNYRLMGMGGQDRQSPNRGGGLVQEIKQLVELDCADWSRRLNTPTEPRMVVIDFLGAAVMRHFTLRGDAKKARDEYTFIAQMFMGDAKQSLANALQTSVWITHQYSGESNSKAKSIYPDHTNSAGFKSFSQHTDYTFCFGSVAEGDNRQLFIAKCDKYRKAPPKPEMICHLDGDFSRIEEPRDKYSYDRVSRQIVQTSEMNQVNNDLVVRDDDGLSGYGPGRRFGP
jgi:hypothetical protein